MKKKIREGLVARLERPEHSGDWHDKPLKWIVCFVDQVFVQKFSTRRHADLWLSIASRAESFQEAAREWDRRLA